MPADTGAGKPSASPLAGAPASASHTPDKPRSASEHRKSSKPIMEKRRRARINESLGQLKTLILDALKKDSSRHSKLEKADILEMTVKHLRSLQRAQMTAALGADPTVLGKYRAGFNECMNEVTRFLSTCEGVTADVRARLLGHLSACLGQMVAVNCPPPAAAAHVAQALPVPLPCKVNPPEALSPKVYGGFQLVPAADGHLAFLIPGPPFPPGSAAPAPPLVPLYGTTAGAGAATPAASPVRGLTSFGAAQAGSPGAERGESVWRPW
ncbi:transcription factor HES-4 isoform 2-T2 [Eudromia elegans]